MDEITFRTREIIRSSIMHSISWCIPFDNVDQNISSTLFNSVLSFDWKFTCYNEMVSFVFYTKNICSNNGKSTMLWRINYLNRTVCHVSQLYLVWFEISDDYFMRCSSSSYCRYHSFTCVVMLFSLVFQLLHPVPALFHCTESSFSKDAGSMIINPSLLPFQLWYFICTSFTAREKAYRNIPAVEHISTTAAEKN